MRGVTIKRYRYRAYPTQGQTAAAARLFGCCRVVWNDALHARETARKNGEDIPTQAEQSAALTRAKKTTERAWLAEVSSVPLQQSLADLNRAYKNFFDSLNGKRKGSRMGAPKFKKRSNRQSARFTSNAGFRVQETTHGVGHVVLPKIGRVRYAMSRPLPSNPSSVTLIKEPDGRYYVSFVVDEYIAPETPDTTRVAGVDVGLADFAAVVYSDGSREKVKNPRWERTQARKMRRAQRELNRRQKGSKNRQKTRLKIATLHRETRNTRADHHRKLALRLVRENQTVAIEGISVRGLARTRMARSVHDAGWGLFLRLLGEKAAQYGRGVVVVDRWAPTTQPCSVCGCPGGKKGLGIRVWKCTECGTVLDRDWNAAVNIILAAGLAESLNACGEGVRPRLAGAFLGEARTRRTVPGKRPARVGIPRL